MANKASKAETAGEPGLASTLQTIEVLRDRHKVKGPIYAGVCAANGWRPGRVMTEEAFLQAVGSFTSAPMGSGRGKEAWKQC